MGVVVMLTFAALSALSDGSSSEALEWARGLGFPALVAGYVLVRLEKAVLRMARRLDTLCVKLGADVDSDTVRRVGP